ncbi:MAG: NAD+ synthase [Saprospiraceae bacterium]|nr:NAD+ synthase [Saprospiraceae bacterium]
MRIALAQLNYLVGDFDGNTAKMMTAVQEAKDQEADLIVFGELSLCGYPPRDFLEFDDFIQKAGDALDVLAKASMEIAIIVGTPTINPVVEGKDLYNSAVVLYEGKVIHQSNKALLPTYDVFDEYRYFEPATAFSTFELFGKRIALTICEDIWNIHNENPLYRICPMDKLVEEGPDFMINISASPFHAEHHQERLEVVQENATRYEMPLFYINNVGAQTELIFDGGSVVVDAKGNVCHEMPYFQEAIEVVDSDNLRVIEHASLKREPIEQVHDALVLGMRDYFGKLGFSKAILGLSGGIDSAVTAAIAVHALGAENVWGVLMPSRYSSQHSVEDARALAENLGMRHSTISIEEPFKAFESQLGPIFTGLPPNVTEENMQARCRGLILMALSNKFGHILLNTSNKSEAAVGYGTLYGDMCGGLSVLGDLYKMQVYTLAHFINRDGVEIPINSINKPPSAELRPDQKDSDSLPDYDILDEILQLYIEEEMGPQEIIAQGHDPNLVARILRLVNINEFKRHQTAPVLRVSKKAFGMGRRLPIVGKYLS